MGAEQQRGLTAALDLAGRARCRFTYQPLAGGPLATFLTTVVTLADPLALAVTVLTEAGQVQIEVPRDRDGRFSPQLVRKRKRRLSGVDDLVISLSAIGLKRYLALLIWSHVGRRFASASSRRSLTRTRSTAHFEPRRADIRHNKTCLAGIEPETW